MPANALIVEPVPAPPLVVVGVAPHPFTFERRTMRVAEGLTIAQILLEAGR